MSLRGVNLSERRGNPLHAKYACRQGDSLPGSQWIATGYALAMTIPEESHKEVVLSYPLHYVIARDAVIHCFESRHADKAVRIPGHSGSPRAVPSR